MLSSSGDGSQQSTEYTADGRDPYAPHIETSAGLMDYIHEPDGAIIRAGLVAHLTNEASGAMLDPTIAYFTSDQAAVPAANGQHLTHSYRVMDAIPYNVKALRAYLRDSKVGRVTIKKRGISVTPEQLRPQLSLKGDNEATLILTRVNNAKTAIVVEPS